MTITREEAIIRAALSQVGVRETARNTGPMIDVYLRGVGLPPGNAWCAAFASWASGGTGIAPRFKASASVHRLFHSAQETSSNPAPGRICCVDHGVGLGHCWIVVSVHGDLVVAVEGNTNPGGSREGDGVYLRVREAHPPGLLGYIVP